MSSYDRQGWSVVGALNYFGRLGHDLDRTVSVGETAHWEGPPN
jgi:hypothetical protein